MKRINLIIRKKHLMIAGLALVLGVGLYANFAIGANKSIDSTTNKNNYGDTEFVKNDKTDEETNKFLLSEDVSSDDAIHTFSESYSDKYFAQARLDKKKSRAESAETLQTIYSGGDLTKDELVVATQAAVEMKNMMETETKIETVLKAQGFEDVLCYLSGKSANIIVKTPKLDTVQAAQIKNALLSEVEVANENITIVEIN